MEYDTYIEYFYNTGVAMYDEYADYTLMDIKMSKTYALYTIKNP